ncbi:unnamed protein product [Ectocarpus sp. 12 AP-2014]
MHYRMQDTLLKTNVGSRVESGGTQVSSTVTPSSHVRFLDAYFRRLRWAWTPLGHQNFVLGIAVFASFLSMFFIFNGFFIDPNNMPDFWLWLYWISPLRYSWEAMAKIVIDGQSYAGLDTCVTCYGTTGEQVLDSLSNGGTNLNDVSIGAWCGALVGLALVWRVIHYVALKRSIF